MDTSFEINIWADSITSHWRSKEIELEDGASELQINEVEKVLEFQFPGTFKSLYKRVNGFKACDWNEHMVSIWPLDRILKQHSLNRFPNFVGFGDFLINSHVFGFLKDRSEIFKFYDLPGTQTLAKIANSFNEAIDLINANSALLY